MPRTRQAQFAYTGLLAAVFVVALAWQAGRRSAHKSITTFTTGSSGCTIRTALADRIDRARHRRAFSTGVYGRLGLRKALADGPASVSRPRRPKRWPWMRFSRTAPMRSQTVRLERAFRATRNLILPCDLLRDGSGWDDPLPRFRRWAAAWATCIWTPISIGVGRALTLEKAAGHDRRWALSLEAFRVSRGATISGDAARSGGGRTSPSRRTHSTRPNACASATGPPDPIRVPVGHAEAVSRQSWPRRHFAGKIVFAGVTAQTETERPLADALLVDPHAGRRDPWRNAFRDHRAAAVSHHARLHGWWWPSASC